MEQILVVKTINPDDDRIIPIINELSQNLQERFGSDGRNSFVDWKNNHSKYLFAIAELNSKIVGCGAIRPLSETVGEVKRMYSKYPRMGIGQTILTFLETKAKELDYLELVLETRVKNEEACLFYQKSNYQKIPNYGKYVNNAEAVCFSKCLLNR